MKVTIVPIASWYTSDVMMNRNARGCSRAAVIVSETSRNAFRQFTRVPAGAGERGTSFVAVIKQGPYLLQAKKRAMQDALSGISSQQRELDVIQLHKILLERVLGISEEAIRNQDHVRYERDAFEAISQVRQGANVAFLMNPARIEQVRDIAFSGEVLPQKSTDFYPKLLSGMTIYALE